MIKSWHKQLFSSLNALKNIIYFTCVGWFMTKQKIYKLDGEEEF